MLKEFIQKWLGIENAEALAADSRLFGRQMSGSIYAMSVDYENTLAQIIELQQKFDVLAEALGIVIVPDMTKTPPEPTIASIRENGLLGSASEYINAVMVADKLIGVMYSASREQAKLFDELSRNRRKTVSART
jgi:hypothetical protein